MSEPTQLTKLAADLAAMTRTILAIPPERWLLGVLGPALFFAGSVLQNYFPRWGPGPTVLIAHAQRGATWPQFAFANLNRTFTPLVLGTISAGAGQLLPAIALLSFGLTGLVYYGARQRTLRHRVVFCRNQFKLNNTVYRYSDLTDIRNSEGGRELRWKKFCIRLTTEEYEKIHPSILEQGWGDTDTFQPSLDLK